MKKKYVDSILSKEQAKEVNVGFVCLRCNIYISNILSAEQQIMLEDLNEENR